MKKDLELQHHQIFEEIKQLDSYTDKATAMFTITQTEEKLKRDNIQGKTKANQTHYEVGKNKRNYKRAWWNYARGFTNSKDKCKAK